MSSLRILAAGAVAVAVLAGPAGAQNQLNVICPVQAEWCNAAAVAFEKETGIKVAMTLKGSGESFAQIAAEKANPKLDVWFGGTGDPHLQAAEQGLPRNTSRRARRAPAMGAKAGGAVEVPHCGHVPRRARHRLQHGAVREEEACRHPRAGKTSSSRSSRAKCRWPIPMPRARPTRRSRRWCRCSARRRRSSISRRCTRTSTSIRARAWPDQGGGARRDAGQRLVHPRRRHRGAGGLSGEGRGALRGNRLRNRLAVDRQRRAQPRPRRRSSSIGH